MNEADITLRDGRVVHLREVVAADEPELQQAFHRMSAETRYLRFMSVVRELDPERVRSRIAELPEAGIGIVATVPAADGIDIVGGAMAAFAGDRQSCEFAVHVASGFGGSGLATTIMKTLIDEARASGIKEMEGFVLTQNQPMLRLARRLGFRIESVPGDPTVRCCRMDLTAP